MCNKGQNELQIDSPLNNQTVLNNVNVTEIKKFEKVMAVGED